MIIYHCFPGGVYKALTMSYDDGCTEDRRLVEIFNRHGIKGTFNINSSWLGNPDTVTAEEVRTLYAGHEVATHTLTHPAAARWETCSEVSPVSGSAYTTSTGRRAGVSGSFGFLFRNVEAKQIPPKGNAFQVFP